MITSMLCINIKFTPHAIINQSTCQFAQLNITNIQKSYFNIINIHQLNKTWRKNTLTSLNPRKKRLLSKKHENKSTSVWLNSLQDDRGRLPDRNALFRSEFARRELRQSSF